MSTYERPQIRELGSVRDLTRGFNKVGQAQDDFTVVTQGIIIGSVVNPN